METVKTRNPPFLKVIFSLSVDIMKANTNVLWWKTEEKNNEEIPSEKKNTIKENKNLKSEKIKPNLLFPNVHTLLALSSFVAPSSHARSHVSLFLFCALSCSLRTSVRVGILSALGVRSVLVNPKFISAKSRERDREKESVAHNFVARAEGQQGNGESDHSCSHRKRRSCFTRNTRSKKKQMIYKYIQTNKNQQTHSYRLNHFKKRIMQICSMISSSSHKCQNKSNETTQTKHKFRL